MGLFSKVKRMLGGQPQPVRPPAPMTAELEPDELVVPEMTVAEVRAALAGATPPLILDIREQYEWNQVHIAGALHIPMNRVPERLADLPTDRPIAVICAHGSRSYGVTHFLCEQGVDAWNVKGGITQWHVQGGPVEIS
jgi:rhodanese-related sulfurtransferase